MLYIFTGNGKGKTTAALGQALRAVGEGKRVLMVQFIKGPWKSGEDILISKIKQQKAKIVEFCPELLNLEIVKTGKGFVGILGDKLPRAEHAEAAEEAFVYAQKEAESGNWDIIILDEINNAVSLGLISKEKVLDFLEARNHKLDAIIMTGRDAPEEFIKEADLVTEMQDTKHPFTEGSKGKRGLEY